MAFADSIRTDNYTREELASLIEGALVVDSAVFNDTANISTTSTGDVTTGTSVTVNVSAGQQVLTGFFMGASVDVAEGTAFAILYENGVTTGAEIAQYNGAVATSGNITTLSQVQLHKTPATGSVIYEIYYSKSGAPTNVYSTYRFLWALVLQAA